MLNVTALLIERKQYLVIFLIVLFKNGFQRDTSFPLIDSSSQNQIRRRIVLEKLSKV